MADSLSLSVGDRLVYPNQGLCTVTEIKNETIAGHELLFVSLVILETGARVKVPQEKLVKNGVRRISTHDDVKAVVAYLQGDSEKASLDWKKRARDNTARLSEGGLLGLAEVVKGLQVLSELRPLPPKEREQYNDARHLFVEELAAALQSTPADAEDALDIVLFPVGKERPKRSIEEFQGLVGGDDEFGISEELPLDAEEADAEEPEAAAADEGEASSDEQESAEEPAAKPAKAPKAAKARASADDEATAPASAALPEAAASPKKRGRPPKPKPETTAEPAPPKKRGRPPKPKPAEPEAPKKRGRPPKTK